ncbi:MAG TPA: hypothetical protein VJJ55_02430 [Candidatus Paceibacterota bacterium]
MKTIFLLGVDDPEMRAIERLLAHAGVLGGGDAYRIAYAVADGRRVHPGNAYRADPVDGLVSADTLVRVECEPREIAADVKVVVVDHHRDGDPGYGLPPAKYWEASSIGQMYNLLSEEIVPWPHGDPEAASRAFGPVRVGLEAEFGGSEGIRALAAMDHCFPAAVRGECQTTVTYGPTPAEVLAVKYREIAAGTKSDEAAVRDRVEFFKRELDTADDEVVGTQAVKDLRHHDLGAGYSLDLLATQVAVTTGGHAALLRHRDRDGQPEKWTLSGNATTETVLAFKEVWAPAHGLVRVYGVPERGYAGGYTA